MTKSPDVSLELSAPELNEKWKPSSWDVCAEHWYGISDQPPRRSAPWGSSPKLEAHCIATWHRYSVFISVPGKQGSLSPIFKNVFPLMGCWFSDLTSRMNTNFWLYQISMKIYFHCIMNIKLIFEIIHLPVLQPRISKRRDMWICHSCGCTLTNIALGIAGFSSFVTMVSQS